MFWLQDLSFQKTTHLKNPWNENKPVKIGRDGQEIEPSKFQIQNHIQIQIENFEENIYVFAGIAEELCKLFAEDPKVEMTPILRRSKESARRQRARPESERSQDVPPTRPLSDRLRPPPPSFHSRKRKQVSTDSQHSSGASRAKYNKSQYSSRSSRAESSSQRFESSSRLYQRRGSSPASSSSNMVSRSYEDYLRSVGKSNRPSNRDSDYLFERRSSRPSYDRSVDDFIRRNETNRRYRDRRWK